MAPKMWNVTKAGEMPDLAAVKVAAKTRIDEAAERERLRHITPGAGQAMTYQQKAAEAAACQLDVDPQPANYPLLAAEIGITAESLLGVAAVVAASHAGWIVLGAAIERIRLQAKAAVDAAEDAAAVHAAVDSVVWP